VVIHYAEAPDTVTVTDSSDSGDSSDNGTDGPIQQANRAILDSYPGL
jgi:hypothetical protein